ncbi:RNA polymerase sigma factor [Streptomyces sp. NPDC048111]|uniref:RNA polymerase sigma factor n=1 Tax=Streptomyces sp. NPDC048111 TaxID=3365500 RepID=UPI0037117C5A
MTGLHHDEFSDLIHACRAGDQRAWAELHDRCGPLVLRIVRSFRLQQADAEDVCQQVWARVYRDLHALRATDRLRAWLATVARREALRHLGRTRRDVPVGVGGELDDLSGPGGGPEERVVSRAEQDLVRAAVRRIPPLHQELVSLLFADPPVGYDRISEKLGIPRGSIGPLRKRIVERLGRTLAEEDW